MMLVIMGMFGILTLPPSDQDDLKGIAKTTWEYFKSATYEETGLTDDHISLGESICKPDRTTPTNIAMYLFAVSCAKNLDFIAGVEAVERFDKTLTTLESMERNRGFYLNWYIASTGKRLETFDGKPCPPFLSSVDNAWLAAGLVMMRGEHPDFAPRIDKILNGMDFRFFYDPETKFFFGGYDILTAKFTGFHYGILLSETRVINYMSASLNQVSIDTIDSLIRERRDGIVLSCYGSMFEAMVVPLFFPSIEDSPSWKEELRKYCEDNIKKTVGEFWGTSYCDDGRGLYKEFGVDRLAIYPMPYEREGVIAPYASFLALQTNPDEALANIRRLKSKCYTKLGFSGSYRPKTGEMSARILTLDQGCIFMAIANHVDANPARAAFRGMVAREFPKD